MADIKVGSKVKILKGFDSTAQLTWSKKHGDHIGAISTVDIYDSEDDTVRVNGYWWPVDCVEVVEDFGQPFQIGDRVRILKGLDGNIGKTAIIIDICGDRWDLQLDNGKLGGTHLSEQIELVTAFTGEATVPQGFGPFPSLAEMMIVNNVDKSEPGGFPRWELSTPYGIRYVKLFPIAKDLQVFSTGKKNGNDQDKIASYRMDKYKDSEARLLDPDGKPMTRKYLSLTKPQVGIDMASKEGPQTVVTTIGPDRKIIKTTPYVQKPEVIGAATDGLVFPIPSTRQIAVSGFSDSEVLQAVAKSTKAELAVPVPVSTYQASGYIQIKHGPEWDKLMSSMLLEENGSPTHRKHMEPQKATSTSTIVTPDGQHITFTINPLTLPAMLDNVKVVPVTQYINSNGELTMAQTGSNIDAVGVAVPKPKSRAARAFDEAKRRVPVALSVQQLHDLLAKEAAKAFRGTAAEKRAVSRFVKQMISSNYGKAGLAGMLAAVIPAIAPTFAPLLGKHIDKVDPLADELAAHAFSVLGEQAGNDLFKLAAPLQKIIVSLITNFIPEPQQITDGGPNELNELTVNAAPVKA